MKHILKVFIRNFLKNKTISLINIIGLSVAMAVILNLITYIEYEYILTIFIACIGLFGLTYYSITNYYSKFSYYQNSTS